MVAVFAAGPLIDAPEWEESGPHRLIVCPDVSRLRPTRRANLAVDAVRLLDADVWVVPAAQRATAERYGPISVFCEIDLPRRPFAEGAGYLIVRRHPFTLSLVEALGDLRGRGDAAGQLLTRTLAETLRLDLIDRFVSWKHRHTRSAVAVLDETEQARLLNYIERETCNGNVSMAALAACVGMGVDRFARAFAATFHTTPRQYILDRRIAHAKALLLTSTMTVAEIGAAVGFSSQSHFTTTFGNRVGVAPMGLLHE
ncbi:putative transcriptional regulator, AraC family protein [Mycolicibacterium mageritense]|uniref:Transcriptional regulator, AraC family protein n=1 Tax=Mycolicibacterium mageritense TaxID=53462 RepID=A0ABM7HVC3_MYCME|nr:putative transcriptional regulator, AraC family protein [Mycolicibacterium mageritense]